MSLEGPQEDRADPAIRAAGRLEDLRLGDRNRRMAGALVLGGLAVAAPAVAEPLTGNPGASVGAALLSVLLVALAVVAWPYPWLPEEREHRELEAIWQEVRADPDAQVAWDRYAAWARSQDEMVELVLVRCAPSQKRVGGAPSAYSARVVRRLDAEDAAAAAEAMENLRAEASQQEIEAQQDYERARHEAEWAARDQALREIDRSAAAEIAAREQELEREAAEQQAAERAAEAEALARSLRRP